MAEIKAKTLYDFQGDPAGGELTFVAEELLTIVRQDIGAGWLEARNANGQQGLVPEAYLEIQSLPEPSMPPPPPPVDYVSHTPQPSAPPAQHYDDNSYADQPQTTDSSAQLTQQASYDDWDEDWDDDDSSTTTEQTSSHAGGSAVQHRNKRSSGVEGAGYSSVRRGFHRFSTFSKSGGDLFLLSSVNPNISESEMVKIIEGHDGKYQWAPPDGPYTCMLASPKKSSKLKGLKSFITYQLTPTFSGVQVSRRYKHFDWLHERLDAKFPMLAVPPLPDKQVTGRYEEDFIQERMRQLQLWVNRMCSHPVVSKSDVLLHFMSCTDEKRWKVGKRKAEKDEFQGAKFFLTIQTPPVPLDTQKVEKDVDNFERFTKTMDDNVRKLVAVTQDNQRKHMGPFKKEFQKMGNAFSSLAVGFELDDNPGSKNLTAALQQTGKTYDEIGKLFEQQASKDLVPLIESVYEYKGILSAFPDVITVHKGTMARVYECKKSLDESKMTESEYQNVVGKGDIVSYSTLAEIDHFQKQRVVDYKLMMQSYLQQQIQFYQKITSKLQDSLAMYDQA